MSVTITFASGTRSYRHALTQQTRRGYDRRMYRPPFGSNWKQEGTGEALPERVGVSVEVYRGGMVFGADPSQETTETLVTYSGSQVTYSGDNVTYSADQSAEDGVAALLQDAEDATTVETPYWWASVAGLTRSVVTPLHAGYRVDLEWVAKQEPGIPELAIQDAPTSGSTSTNTVQQNGWEFTLSQDVTAIGGRVHSPLDHNGTLRIWRVSDTTLLAGADVAGEEGAWVAASFTPVALSSGTNYVVSWEGPNRLTDEADVTFNPLVSFVQGRFVSSAGDTFPSTTAAASVRGIADLRFIT